MDFELARIDALLDFYRLLLTWLRVVATSTSRSLLVLTAVGILAYVCLLLGEARSRSTRRPTALLSPPRARFARSPEPSRNVASKEISIPSGGGDVQTPLPGPTFNQSTCGDVRHAKTTTWSALVK